MQRYFFHLRDGTQLYRDEEGIVLGSRQEILIFASELAGALVDPTIVCDWGQSSIEVTDRTGDLTLVLSLPSLLTRPRRLADAYLVEARVDQFRAAAAVKH